MSWIDGLYITVMISLVTLCTACEWNAGNNSSLNLCCIPLILYTFQKARKRSLVCSCIIFDESSLKTDKLIIKTCPFEKKTNFTQYTVVPSTINLKKGLWKLSQVSWECALQFYNCLHGFLVFDMTHLFHSMLSFQLAVSLIWSISCV